MKIDAKTFIAIIVKVFIILIGARLTHYYFILFLYYYFYILIKDAGRNWLF